MYPTTFSLLSMFVFHAVSLFVLCPFRYSIKKTASIWSISVMLSLSIGWLLLSTFPTAGLYVSIAFTMFLFLLTTLFVSSYEVPKTLFLFLAYAQAFMVLVFLTSNMITHVFFDESYVAMSIIRYILHTVLAILCGTLVKSKFDIVSNGIVKGWWPINIMSFLLLNYLCLLIIHSVTVGYGQFEMALFFLLLSMTIAVYWVFFHTINYMHNSATTEQLELQSDFLRRQVKDMQESIENAKRIYHDARHHKLQIAEYVHNGEFSELLNYLDQYEEESLRHLPIRLCNNTAANNILSAYARRAKQNGIAVNFDVSMEQNIGLKDTDIVAILANIMENSITGCLRSEAEIQFIDLSIGRKAGKLVIQSRNTAAADKRFENTLPLNNYCGGIGISSILASTRSYGGEADFQNNNGVFTCRVLLKIPKKNDL